MEITNTLQSLTKPLIQIIDSSVFSLSLSLYKYTKNWNFQLE